MSEEKNSTVADHNLLRLKACALDLIRRRETLQRQTQELTEAIADRMKVIEETESEANAGKGNDS